MDEPSVEPTEEAPPTGFARKSAVSFLGQVVSFVCNFAVGVLLARLLGAEGKGAYALIGSTVAIVSSIIMMGMPFAATFFVGRHKWPPVRTLLLACCCALVPLGVVLLALAVIGPERVFVKAAFSPDVAQLAWVMLLLGVPMRVVTNVVSAVLRGRELIVETVWPTIVTAMFRTGLVVAVLLLVWNSVTSVVFADLVTAVLGLFLLGLVMQMALRTWPPSGGRPILRRLVSYGIQIQASDVLFILWLRADLYLVNYFRGEAAAGLYSVAMVLAEFATFPSYAVTSVLFPRLSLSGPAERLEQAMQVHRAVVILSAAMGVGLAGAAFLIPAVYGKSFAPAIVPALICLGGCVLWAGLRVLHNFFAAEDRPMLPAAADAVGVVCMLGLDLLLIPRLGIRGAAAAYAASLIVTYAVTVWLGFRMSLLGHLGALVPRRSDAAVVARALRAVLERGRKVGNFPPPGPENATGGGS